LIAAVQAQAQAQVQGLSVLLGSDSSFYIYL
jgi:hypothetical protein